MRSFLCLFVVAFVLGSALCGCKSSPKAPPAAPVKKAGCCGCCSCGGCGAKCCDCDCDPQVPELIPVPPKPLEE